MHSYVMDLPSVMECGRGCCTGSVLLLIRPSVDGLCRDGPSEISRDPRTKRLETQPKRLGWL